VSERDDAIRLANAVLDDASRDPDDDLAMISRQFLRSLERHIVSVPAEPTEAMISAGYDRLSKLYEQKATSGMEIRETAARAYRAMIAAAPVHPA
jgi:hypothetical protein